MADRARISKSATDDLAGKKAKSVSAVSADNYDQSEKSSAIGASAVNRSTFSLGSGAAQTKVTVGQAGDRYEREADAVAENVVAGRDVGTISRIPAGGLSAQTDLLQREESGEESGEENAQTQDGEAQEKCAACDTEDKAQTATEEANRETPVQAKDAAQSDSSEAPVQEKCSPCDREEAEQSPQSNPTAEAATHKPGQAKQGLQGDVQTKVAVGRAGGSHESEADNVAERVSRGRDAGPISTISGGGLSAQTKTIQHQEEDEGGEGASAMDEVQEKCAACESEDSAQTSPEGAGEATGDGGADGSEAEAGAQTLVQRDAEEGEEEADETAEDASDEGPIGGEDDPDAPDCGESGAGAAPTGEGAGEESAEDTEESVEEATEEEAETEEGGEEDGEAESSAGDDEGGGCGEEGGEEEEAEPESGPTTEAHGEQSCGGGGATEEAGESGEGEAGPEGEAGEEAAPPPLVPEAAPPCADQVAEPEDTSTEMADSGETEGEGAGGEQGGCDSAQAQTAGPESESSSQDVVQEQEDDSGTEKEDIQEKAAQRQSGDEGREPGQETAETDNKAQAMTAQRQTDESDAEEGSADTDTQAKWVQRESEEPVQQEQVDSTQNDSAQMDGETDCAPAETEAVAQTQVHGQVQAKSGTDRRRDEKSAIAGEAIKNRGAGDALAPEVRERLEKPMRVDLADVRVHTGTQAETANKGLRSRAFTHKSHVWLAAGESPTDLRLMAHELTHSVQQGAIAQRESGAEGKAENASEQGGRGEAEKTPGQPEPRTQAMPEKGATEEESVPRDASGAGNETGDLTEEEQPGTAESPDTAPGGDATNSDSPNLTAPEPANKTSSQIGMADNADVSSGETPTSKAATVAEGQPISLRDTVKPDEPTRGQNPDGARSDAAGDKTGTPGEEKTSKAETEVASKTPAKESATDPETLSTTAKQSVEANQPEQEEEEPGTSVTKSEKSSDQQKRNGDTSKKQDSHKQETHGNQKPATEKPDTQLRTTAKPVAAGQPPLSVGLEHPPRETTGKAPSLSPEKASTPDAVTATPAAKASAPSGGQASAATAQPGGKQSNSGGAQVPGFMSAPGSASGGRGASSVPVSLGGTDSAAGLMRQFSQISPLQAPFHVKALGRGMGELAKKRREQETEAPPTAEYRPRAPGLTGNTATAKIGDKQQPQNLGGLPGEQQTPPAETVKPHEHPRPAPAVGVSARDEQRVEDIPETDPAATQAAMHEWLNNFTGGLPSDGGVSTDPGPEPQITLSGRYNPNQIQTVSQRGGDQLRREQARRADEPQQDFGENAIAPDAENEEIQSRIRELQPRKGERCPQAEKIERYRFDDEDEQDLAARTRPEFADDYDNEFTRIDNAETNRDVTVARVRADGMADIDAAHGSAYDEELTAVDAGRRSVDAQRLLWREANDDVLLDYEDEASLHGAEVTGEIKKHVDKEQQGINTQRTEVVKQAKNKEKETQAEKTRLENEAKEKEKAQRSRSTISRIGRWIKRKVISIANWLSNKLKEAFNKLRAWVKEQFNRFKKWALEQIEKARRWVNQKLEDFRAWAHKTVDRYLGKYPGIARRFHRAIDTTVDGAKRAVNRTADALKKRVAQIIDFMADAVDAALGMVEGALQAGLWFACNLAVTGINFAILLIDQDIDALIDFINEMPEPAVLGPIWPAVKYALLGFLVTLRDKPEEEKKRYARKTKWLVISPAYYLGVFVGVLKGFVWDGLVGLVVMLKDIIIGIPQAIKAMYDYFSRLVNDVESINAILAEAGEIWQQLKDFINDPDKKEQIVAFLQRVPSIMHEMVREAHRRVKGWAVGAGADAANALYSFVLNSSHYKIGEGVGRVVGRVLFEVALFFFTAGVGTAIKWGAKVLQVLSKAGRLLTSAAKGGSIIMRALNSLRAIVMSGVKLAQRVGQGLRSIFVRLEGLVNRVFSWFRRAFGKITTKVSPRLDRLRRRFGLTPAQSARWRLFKNTLRVQLRSHPEGIRKSPLRGIYRGVLTRFRDVAKVPVFITRHGAHWRLWARRVKGLKPSIVGRVLLDRDTRWRAGSRAIEKAVNRERRLPGNIGVSDISRVLRPIKHRYRYKGQPGITFDENNNQFIIRWSMSNTNIAAIVGGEVPGRLNLFRSITPGRDVVLDNFAYTYDGNYRSPPVGTTPTLTRLDKIRSFPRYSTSAYVRGHLISGHFTHGNPSNWTPITRSANWWMEFNWEGRINRAMKSQSYVRGKIQRGSTKRLKFYKMSVTATGSSGTPIPNRLIMGTTTRRTEPAEQGLATRISMRIVRKTYDASSRTFRENPSMGLQLLGVRRTSAVTNVPNVTRYPPLGYPYGRLTP